MAKYIFLWLIISIPNSYALEKVSLKLARLEMQSWQLHGIEIALEDMSQQNQQLGVSIEKLVLPKPFNDLKLLNIRCKQFEWGNNKIHCQQGTAAIKSKRFDSPRFKFSFLISEPQAQFKIQQLKLLKGTFNLHADAKLGDWSIKLNGKKVGLKLLQQLFLPELQLSSGLINFDLSAKGYQQNLSRIQLKSDIKQLSLQTEDGTKATEALALSANFSAQKYKKIWSWEQHSLFSQGMLYIEPLYLENKNTQISLSSKGYFTPNNQQLIIDTARFNHPTIGFIKAYGDITLKPKVQSNITAYAHIKNLETTSKVYLNSMIETTSFEGMVLTGSLEAGLNIKNNQPDKGYLIANKLQFKDPKQRFDLRDGVISLNWSKDKNHPQSSTISWRQLDVFSIPLPRSYLTLSLKDKHISLLKPLEIPLLGGNIQIKKFDWEAMKDNSPKVVFSGKINDISLEKLTEVLDAKPLIGNISGDIPAVQYEAGKLSLDGGLKINLFDGEIKINQLAAAGLMTDFPQFYSDIEINNLDLDLLTQRFEFGGMQGRLSGYVRDLYMENWKPIQFFAWLGTPEDDDSSHEISQKAVENLASIGGGGAVDLISRTFLGLFDNFGYDKIGLGCYLHQGVCQLMGAEAAGKRGFYIVKGGGLPRIDVMGYNTRIDWEVLWERLSRISQTNEVEIE
ncbi:MAG: C4-dicarboxylate ABC transporter [Methylococcaceae bacterium]|nr:C4-dicarboxylate ABC transporter [Methylococcaceae bacterium]